MIRNNLFQILTPLLVSSLFFSGCGAAAATTSSFVSAFETTTGQPAETAVTAATEGTTNTSAATTNTSTGSTTTPTEPDLSSMSGQEIYDHLYGDLTDLYAMETYDEVPEYLSEWHDDVDYGTIDEDVEYYSTTAGDYKYCNVLLPAGYDESQEYPVLYMYHGFGGRYDSHVHDHSILQTLYGNMLSEGLAVPMIIVGADMYTDILAEKDDKSDAEMRPCYDKGVEDIA